MKLTLSPEDAALANAGPITAELFRLWRAKYDCSMFELKDAIKAAMGAQAAQERAKLKERLLFDATKASSVEELRLVVIELVKLL